MTPETVLHETDAGIAEADRLVALAVDPTQPRTFDNTLLTLSDAAAAVWIAEGRGALIGEVHPDAAIREAAALARERIDRWRNALAQRDDVAAAVRAFADTPDAAALPDRRRRILDLWLRDLRRAGHGLAPATRAELATLRERIVELSATFGRHLREWSESVELEADALDGLSGSFLDQLPSGESGGSKSLPIVPSTIFPFLEQSSRRDLRELVLTKHLGKAAAENRPILDEILTLRRRIAVLMGAASWSDYANELRMSGSAAAVAAFLDRVLPPLQVLAAEEQAAMHALLVADGIDDELRAWDFPYYHERQRRSTGLDSSALAEHFPLEAVLDGLFALVRDVFGVAVTEEAAPDGWHPDVRGFVLSDAATGEQFGICYFDLLARQGKSPGAWSYPLDPGIDRAGSPRRPPVQHLVANFTPAAEGAQPLLPHEDVVTLFHEFGHALEAVLPHADLCWINFGSWTERDFVEAPSQIMEHWAWAPDVLRRFARHHRTDAPVPEALLAPLAASRRLDIGTVMLWFAGYKAVLDQALHGPEAVDLAEAYRKAFEVTGFPFVEGTHVPASFFHIVGFPYDAGYYGYLWAEAIGDDMFTAFRSGGIFSAEVGRRYRQAVLEPGWLVPGRDRVRHFLGRDPSEAAYLERLGIGGTAGRPAEAPADTA
jgi:thimet oligopeptidase